MGSRRNQPRREQPIAGSTTTTPAPSRLPEQKVTRGRMLGYHVSAAGLTFKLDVSAISRLAFSVAADAPHFQAAMSVIMLADNERRNKANFDDLPHPAGTIWVRHSETLPEERPQITTLGSSSLVLTATAVGAGSDDPFEIADWVVAPGWDN